MAFGYIKNKLGQIVRSSFSKAMIDVFEGRAGYICDECGGKMVFEDENEDTLICTQCNKSMDLERYGFTDEEYEELFECDDHAEESDDDPWDDD